MIIDKFIKQWEEAFALLEYEDDPSIIKYEPVRRHVKRNSSMSIKRPNRNKLDSKQRKKKAA
jgi:hypothetical protein